MVVYALPTTTPATLNNRLVYFKQTVTGPARLAAELLNRAPESVRVHFSGPERS